MLRSPTNLVDTAMLKEVLKNYSSAVIKEAYSKKITADAVDIKLKKNVGETVRKTILPIVFGSLLLTATLWILSQHYWFGINLSQSLPYHFVVIEKNVPIIRGDFIVFRFKGNEVAGRLHGMSFFKRVEGVAGDTIERTNRNIRVNNVDVGFALSATNSGEKLDPITDTIIPNEKFYVRGTHPMSFDSRYAQCGLVHRSQIIGKAHIIF
jgi:conjugal transfer pilin signal peptidase TrbI